MVLGADSAYVIHLDKHKSRKKRMDHLIDKLKLDNVTYIDAIDKEFFWKDTWKNVQGYFDDHFWDPGGYCTVGILCCAMSHRKAYKAFLDSGDEVGLFLEDDVKNTSYVHQLNFDEIREELDNTEWGIAIYGRYKKDILRGEKVTNHFYKNIYHRKQISGHAYLLNRTSAQWLYDNTKKIKYAADILLEISPFKIITLDQSIFTQRFTDLAGYSLKMMKDKMEKYPHLKEYISATTLEANNPDHLEIWKTKSILISKFVPAESYRREVKIIQGKSVEGTNIKIGRSNKIFKRIKK